MNQYNKKIWLRRSILLCLTGFEAGYMFSTHLVQAIFEVFRDVMTHKQVLAFYDLYGLKFEKWYIIVGLLFALLFWGCGMCVFFLIERLKETKDE